MAEKSRPRFFEEALSDFTHDAASGGAIRHMVDLGYTVPMMMERLDYPTPRARVEQTVYKYMLKKGILIEDLGATPEDFSVTELNANEKTLYQKLRQLLEQNGAEHAYVTCPFGLIYKDREARLKKIMESLTSRERDYLMGIPWEMKLLYHQLDSRMMEIAPQLFQYSKADIRFYFLKTKDCIIRKDA